jgi:hypothetical protein
MGLEQVALFPVNLWFEHGTSLAKVSFDVLVAMKHVQDHHALILDGIDNDVFPDRKATQTVA